MLSDQTSWTYEPIEPHGSLELVQPDVVEVTPFVVMVDPLLWDLVLGRPLAGLKVIIEYTQFHPFVTAGNRGGCSFISGLWICRILCNNEYYPDYLIILKQIKFLYWLKVYLNDVVLVLFKMGLKLLVVHWTSHWNAREGLIVQIKRWLLLFDKTCVVVNVKWKISIFHSWSVKITRFHHTVFKYSLLPCS